jgi:hypothetical protein
MSIPVDVLVSEAIAAAMSAKSFSGVLKTCPTVYREYVDPEAESFSSLQGFVSPGELDVAQETRGADMHTVLVQILIGMRCESDAAKRNMRVLRAEIVDMLRSETLPQTTPAFPENVKWARCRTIESPGRQLLGMDIWLCAISAEYLALMAKE